MKRKLLKRMGLAAVTFMVGLSAMADETLTPSAEDWYRVNSSGAYVSGYPKNYTTVDSYENRYTSGFFVLQQYDLSAIDFSQVQSIDVTLTYVPTKASGQMGFWIYGDTYPTSSTDVSTIVGNVTTAIGLAPTSTTGTYNDPLAINSSSASVTINDTDYTQKTATFSGDALTTLYNALQDGKLNFIVTRDVVTNTGQGFCYSAMESNGDLRPMLTVHYYPVYNTTTSTGYSSLEAAVAAVTGTETLQVNDDVEVASTITIPASTSVTIVPDKDGVKISRAASLTSAIMFLNNQTGATLTMEGSTDKSLIIDGNGVSSSAVTFESSKGTTLLKDITIQNAVSTATQGIFCFKSAGTATLDGVTFDNCTVSDGYGIVFIGLNDLVLKNAINFTNCTGYNIYLEKRLRVDATEPLTTNNPISLYYKSPALGYVAGTTVTSDDIVDMFYLANDGYGLIRKSSGTSAVDMVMTEGYDLSVSAVGASTLVLPYETTIPSGINAYTLAYTSGDAEVTATKVDAILPANTPVLINGDEGNYKFTSTSVATSSSTATTLPTDVQVYGTLTGVYASTTAAAGSFVLQNNDDNLGFYVVGLSEVTVPAYRAYIASANTTSAKLSIVYGGTTGIDTVKTTDTTYQADGRIYNIAGQLVDSSYKGVVIKNGKKYLNK
ncbi:MAG: hypothetical protein I3J02_06700 [Prevotella sp.]|nr:hypothetical protein [Prevotella sp.]